MSIIEGGIAGGDQTTMERRIREIINKASSLMEKALYREAKLTLEKGLGFDPHNMGMWERLVVCNLELKRPKAAIEVINRIVKIQPTAVKYWSDKGYLHLLLSEYPEGITALEKSLRLNPRDDRIWLLLGLAYIAKESYEDALDAFESSLLLNPNSEIAWYNSAVCHFFLENYEESVAAAERAFAIDPGLEQMTGDWLETVHEVLDDEDGYYTLNTVAS